jgi:hypothetical protein
LCYSATLRNTAIVLLLLPPPAEAGGFRNFVPMKYLGNCTR